MGWREYAEKVQRGGDVRDNGDKSPVSAPIVPIVPNVPVAIASNRLREWRGALSRLDPCQPHPGFSMGRWQTLYDASWWWLDAFGEGAVRNGWSVGDVFGLLRAKAGWGGLIDRLGDNRSLVMTADHATWRWRDVVQSYNRTAGENLLPWWEIRL